MSNEINMLTTSYKYLRPFILALMLAFGCVQLQAKEYLVSVTEAWVRATHPGQEVGAAYMTLLSKQDMTLVSVESSVTDSVEIHNMSMENGVMKMRMLENLPLKAGKPYKLAPGGFHLMLFDLKKPLIAGEQISFTLHFKTNNKQSKKASEYKQTIKVNVQTPPETASH